MNIDGKQILFGGLYFLCSIIVLLMAFIGAGYDNIPPLSFVGIDIQAFMYIFIALSIYFAFFTKYNNPFKKKEADK